MSPREQLTILRLVDSYSRTKHGRFAESARFCFDGSCEICFRPTKESSLPDDGFFVTIPSTEMEAIRQSQSLTLETIRLLDEELVP
jgi:hypothetical protein